ncbi:MAG: DUF4932 domain-containing protein, partial [Anaerolineae bacterium]|nr:DUF4932 domain-containing protein [Anaerolineae bacterium]
HNLKPVQQTNRSIHVSIDPRVELMSIIQYISHYREVFPFLLSVESFPYAEAVIKHFLTYADHPVVKTFDAISQQPRMFNFMAPPTTALYLRADLTLRDDVVWPETVLARISGHENLETFLEHLQAFSEVTGFADFYAGHRAYYEALVAAVIPKLGVKDYVQELEAFYGMHQSSYNLILVSLYGHVGFGPYLDMVTGERHIYNILGPQELQDDMPVFGDEAYFKLMQRHEFSHSFVNPLTDKHWAQAQTYAHVYVTLPAQKVCGEWQECVNEYIIRAVTTYLAFQDSEVDGQAALEAERGKDVVLIDALLASIRDYATHREQCSTLDEYYPRLLETFDR